MDSAKREDDYREPTSEGGIGPVSRRKVLEGIGAAGVSLLAGCANSKNSTETSDQTDSSGQGTTQNGETETETDPLEQTHRAERLDDVVQELEQDTVTLNLQPADTDAEYANSTIFNDYNGELKVELDLNQALDQRQFNNRVTTFPHVQDFYQNAHREEWRQQTHQQYIEEANGENILGLKEEVDWELYMNGENLDERLEESGVHDLWYKHSIAHPEIDGISSSHNGIKAAAYQNLEHQHGHNTVIWQHFSEGENGGHGLIAATENPTRNPEQTGQQQNYVIETDPRRQQIAKVEESMYFDDEIDTPDHPSHPDHDDDETGMYIYTGMMNAESELGDKIGNFSESLAHQFTDEWFRNPESEPAFDYFDRTNSVAYIAEENNGRVHHTAEEIQFETSV